MSVLKFLDSFQLNDYFVIANEVGNKSRRQRYAIINSLQLCFPLIWYPLILEFNLKSVLIHFLSKTTTEITMNSHCRTDNLMRFFWKCQIRLMVQRCH